MWHTSSLDRYAGLIESLIKSQVSFEDFAQSPTHIRIEHGGTSVPIKLPTREIAVVDASGHTRPVYRPLLVYSWLLSTDVETNETELCRWIDSLDNGIWSALVRAAAGRLLHKKSLCDAAADAFAQLIDNQQPSGAFLAADSHANPETRWYEELTLLHALSSYWIWAADPAIDLAVEKSAHFHLQETQPDHASAQPWGLLAFIRFAPPLADQVLHALMMQYPTGVTGVPLLLLTDVLYGLRQLIERSTVRTHTENWNEQRS